MRTNVTLAILLVLLFTQTLCAQKQNNHWYWGVFAGIDFTSGTAVAVSDGAMYTNEGTSVISDPNGNLLMYTDGIDIYNREHKKMPNGTGLMGDVSTTQSALILPKPGDPNLYYVFTQDDWADPNGFRYSLVSMPLDSGRGDVTVKNVFIRNHVTEKLSATTIANGSGWWVMIHDWGSNAFRAYRLTATGFDTAAVVSNAGTVHQDTSQETTQGQLKFSPDGTRLAVAIGNQGLWELFDFDNATGVVSNPHTFAAAGKVYGLEFSPDGSKIYISHNTPGVGGTFYLAQYNLSSGVDSLIRQSRLLLSTDGELRGLQLAPDKKIYVARGFGESSLSVIDSPDLAGLACHYIENGFALGTQCGLGLPNCVTSAIRPDTIMPVAGFGVSTAIICPGTCVNFNDLSQHLVTSWQWRFPGASPDSSADQHPQNICYEAPGNYAVTLIAGNLLGYDTLTIIGAVAVRQRPPVSITVNGDTLTAFNAVTYQWYLNDTLLPGDTLPQLIADVPGSYTLHVTDNNGCSAISSPYIITGINDVGAGGGLKVFPVPAEQYIMVQLPETGNVREINLYNALGQLVHTANTVRGENIVRIGIQHLPAGFYTVRSRFDAGMLSSVFIKQ